VKKDRGFTLIELVVVVAIIAIVATIALPSYTNYVRKARRNAAEASMQQIGLLEERFRADNTAYTTAWASLGSDPSGTYYKYTLAVTAAAGTTPATYTITATPLVDQLNDNSRGTSCNPLTLGVTTTGVLSKTPAICWGQ
jgi:type IV pilus assembly protein PilE